MNTTEASSHYDSLEKMSVHEILSNINREDRTVPGAIEKVLPEIELLTKAVIEKMKLGGRLFYIGAGTSGRLGVVDASEIPPTYGVPQGVVVGIIAGGDKAIRKAVEHAEDDRLQAWKDLKAYRINTNDVVIGIAASGRTPYVLGGIQEARSKGLTTGGITCNADSELSRISEFPIQIVVGPEFVTGSTRMKSGTAQKLVLNMISTTVMIQLGHVKGNKMIDMTPTNNKLIRRGVEMIMTELGIDRDAAEILMKKYGTVRKAIEKGI